MSRSKNKRQLITLTNPRSPISESYRALRTNIDFSSIDEKLQVIMISSAGPGEGKTTTISNLAIAYAQSERRTLLIDADLRKPTAHHTFSVSNRWGLSSVISQQCSLEEAIQMSNIPNLDIVTSGTIPPNPAEMLGSNRMAATIEQLRELYDVILIDTPPLLAVTDAQIVASKCDGAILVVDQGKVKRDIGKKAIQNLQAVNARILGVVLNNVKRKANEEAYYYYYGAQE
ncbi:CpsD/CapB family tyrosine-protein kinase [Paenibacillus sp. LHD-117]|uniref:CpsD/CapB family tyrosine-protein kinase n=1 Tax=Paenibacillus sp. LHD-117 TaxID=3071412 RepID=UPI0027E0BB27|nr:CpsD/CapB family tyrosine-protein kinase [Paenibacillus sp. LHD-117]MDQ6420687.1 CpsD/CapB family tyrosine-protein kinase [Paenibacillus sp. LHD-117]